MIIERLFTLFAASTQAQCASDQNEKFLGLIPKWYQYLPYTPDFQGNCAITLDLQNKPEQLLLIGLTVVQSLMAIAGVVAFVYVLYGGFLLITSQGEPDNIKKAIETIRNALIGLAISALAVTIVSFIGNRLGS